MIHERGGRRFQTGLFCCITVDSLCCLSLFFIYLYEEKQNKRGENKQKKVREEIKTEDKMKKMGDKISRAAVQRPDLFIKD